MEAVNIFWFRRDLRLEDNVGLANATREDLPVLGLFVFDTNILDLLEEKADARVEFIYDAVATMDKRLRAAGSAMRIHHGTPEEAFRKILTEYNVNTVFCNHDYEAYALQRDDSIRSLLAKAGTAFKTFKDQVIFEKSEIVKDDGAPYTVYTPYSKKWLATLSNADLKPQSVGQLKKHFLQYSTDPMIALESMGFKRTGAKFPEIDVDESLIKEYDKQRDYPGIDGTTRLGIHLRFGTISIRQLVTRAKELNSTFLNELIWREFYQMILCHFPHVSEGKAFRPEYDQIKWRYDEKDFEKWCQGMTGYPIVDAGMRQLNAIGFMHNRIRMVTASFLSKHLLIDWRWGEAYFAAKLLDFDFAANNGNWQWAAGSGCDASPYFRIFNPYLQTKRFDPDFKYIRKWVPEFEDFGYPEPIVDHQFARERCLKVYKTALDQHREKKVR